jgi:hypothetical protein
MTEGTCHDQLASECRLTKDAARALYSEMAALVGQIADEERAAVDLLRDRRENP